MILSRIEVIIFGVKHIVEDVLNLPYSENSQQSQFFKEFQEVDFNLNNEASLFSEASKQIYIPLANMMTTAAIFGEEEYHVVLSC